MRLGVVIPREPTLKNMGGIVEAALAAGHTVIAFYQAEARGEAKSYQNPSQAIAQAFRDQQPELVRYAPQELARLAAERQLDALIVQEGYHTLSNAGALGELATLRRNGTAVFSLTHFFEVSRLPLEALDHFDLTFFMSEFGIELMFDLNAATPAERAHYRPRMATAGSPTFDQLAGLDRAAARAYFGLPPDRPVVVLAAPVLSPVTLWRWVVWREPALRTRLKRAISARRLDFLPQIFSGPSFERCVAAVRAFCDRHNAVLVVKSRLKQDDPPYLIAAADLYLDGADEEYYPLFTMYRLLAAADLVVSAQSMSLVEAVAANIPAVNIHVPFREIDEPSRSTYARYLEVLLGSAPNSLMNTPGCMWSQRWQTFPRWLNGKTLADFRLNSTRAEEYRQHYLGMDATPSSQRILNIIHDYLNASAETRHAHV